jgi:hypothetical protein
MTTLGRSQNLIRRRCWFERGGSREEGEHSLHCGGDPKLKRRSTSFPTVGQKEFGWMSATWCRQLQAEKHWPELGRNLRASACPPPHFRKYAVQMMFCGVCGFFAHTGSYPLGRSKPLTHSPIGGRRPSNGTHRHEHWVIALGRGRKNKHLRIR